MRTLHLVLYVIAALCFLAAILIPDTDRVRTDTTAGTVTGTTYVGVLTRRLQLVAAGMVFWVLNPIVNLIDDISD
jgi:hypothetical protein